jgi:hypothetical protein
MWRNLDGIGSVLRLDNPVAALCCFCHALLPGVVVQEYNGSAKGMFLATMQLSIGLSGENQEPQPDLAVVEKVGRGSLKRPRRTDAVRTG